MMDIDAVVNSKSQKQMTFDDNNNNNNNRGMLSRWCNDGSAI